MRLPVVPSEIWSSNRGLSGSEISCLMYALHLSRRGHDVTIYWKTPFPDNIENLQSLPYEMWFSKDSRGQWDALCAWMRPEPLKLAPPGAFRLFNQQVADFILCGKGWEDYVDVLTPLSHDHANRLATMTSLPPEKIKIAYNGVDCNTFRPAEKVPGRMIWASSHDRGLHWLLQMFEEVRQVVPEAHLRVFYNFAGAINLGRKPWKRPESLQDLIMNELRERSIITLQELDRLNGKGVEVFESISRERICSEMGTTSILSYPCDPVAYTETFGVTVLEACACGAVPVLCYADAFDELWSSVTPGVPAPLTFHRNEYVAKLIHILKDESTRLDYSNKVREYAKAFDWDILVEKFERCLASRGREGL